MALTLGDNFSYGGSKPLDARLSFATLANMKAVADATMYNGCIAYCVATDKTYQWKSTNTVDAETGRWREFSSGGSEITVDSVLSSTSENPVQNKVIKGALDNKYDTNDIATQEINNDDVFPFYKNSISKTRKSTWANIKSVLMSYFNALYSTVKTRGTPTSAGTDLSLVTTGDMYNWNSKQDALIAGNNVSIVGQTISANASGSLVNNYTKTEQAIGSWIDGKTLYQRTYTGTTPSNADDCAVATISSSISVKHFKGSFVQDSSSNIIVPISYSGNTKTTDTDYMLPYQDGTKLKLAYGANNRSRSYWITIQYTK